MIFKIGATIPVKQYGNLTPEIEVEAPTFEEACAKALPMIESLWSAYVDDGSPLRKHSDRQKLKAFTGNEIWFDPIAHVYTNDAGEVYMSGSQYAAQFEKPFDGKAISKRMAVKYGVEFQDILDMWELKAQTSRDFGTALHAALELYGRYDGLAKKMERTTHIHDHPVLKKAVMEFFKEHDTFNAECEVLVVDHNAKRAGRIDRLYIHPERHMTCRVQDYKTNADIKDHLAVYWKQLKFYGSIMEAAGWLVEGYDIFHWDGSWHTHSQETGK